MDPSAAPRGDPRLDVHGMMLVIVLQALWSVGVGVLMLRTPVRNPQMA